MKASTITRRLSAISQAHKMAGLRVAHAATGRAHDDGGHPSHPWHQAPTGPRLPQEDLVAMIAALPDDLRGLRDRALLLVGFVGGMRRAEVVGLDVDDVVEEPEGLRVTIRRSKTDQEGAGRQVGLVRGRHRMTDVVTAVNDWKEPPASRMVPSSGPWIVVTVSVRSASSDRAVARAIKAAASRVGIDPATVSGHSLRGGFATSAAKAGAPERKIMRTTGHKSEAMVSRYIDEGDLFEESACVFLNLL